MVLWKATYDPFFSLEEDKEILDPQSNEIEKQKYKHTTPEVGIGEHMDAVIKMVQDHWIDLWNDAKHLHLQKMLVDSV